MKSSKSAHVITNCEVYAEVVDAAGISHTPNISANQKRQSYHCGGNSASNNSSNPITSRHR